MRNVNQRVKTKLREELKLSPRSIERRINKKADEPRILDRNLATLILAIENSIEIREIISDDEKDSIRAYYGNKLPVVIERVIEKKKKTSKEKNINIDISYIRSSELKSILKRDIKELNAIVNLGIEVVCKSCIILSGSIAESLLLEALKQKASQVSKYGTHIGKKIDLDKLGLYDLVNIAVNIQPPLLSKDIIPNISQIRKWRNLIHPGREIKSAKNNRIKPSEGRARTAIAVLHFIAEELKKNI